jgi:type III pantothenate kinase
MTTACFDFGNTRLKAAIFENKTLSSVHVLHADALNEDIIALIAKNNVNNAILSSVIDHPQEIENTLATTTCFHKLVSTSKLPFTIPVGKPETVGADRLAIAAAATDLFPGENILVIALGSCVTYNFINTSAELMGGSISPGMEMRFRSMHEYTAKLPLVKADWNVPLVGYDTATNMQSGVVLGMAAEIDGIIDLYRSKFSNFNAVLTGGDIGYFESHLKNKIFADPELIFKGLYAISQLNCA